MKIFTTLLITLLCLNLFSAEKAGVSIPDTMKIKGSDLLLNGIGVRRATFLRIKVYVGGLYLLKKTNKTEEILSQPYPKFISMNFIRDVDKEDLQKAWLEGLEAAVQKNKRAPLMKAFNEFNSRMVDIKKGQSILLTFTKEGIETSIAGNKKPLISNSEFSRALLSVWFINARDEELRDELMGKN
jgi:hypothetical protein